MTRSFGAQSTTDQVLDGIDLTGKRIFVTGVSAGLGVETARALVARGADVVGTTRDLAKAEAATAAVRAAAVAGGSFALVELDLASLASVRRCADALLADGRSFDVIINNAGVMMPPFGRTADGFETQFGTNHLGHFVLTNRIAPLIRDGGRLVVLGSASHRSADVDLEDPGFDQTPYDPAIGYGRSKTSNILFAVAFDRRHRARGIRAAAVHPGGINTELGRHLEPELLQGLLKSMDETYASTGHIAYRLKSVPEGAATSVWAAVVADADAIGGRYCEDCHIAEIQESDVMEGVRAYALDPDRAEALWAKSEEMVDERF